MTKPQIHPICIASPTRRSGTTLIQRLLSSAENTLIYGETCANDFNTFCNLYSSREMLLLQNKDWYNEQTQSVLDGQVNKWIPDLMPDVDAYLNSYKNMITSLADYCAGFAESKGRPLWGMKMPEWNPVGLSLVQKILPQTKVIYLHRNLEDCIRSAKKIQMVIDPQEIHRFCITWQQFTNYANTHFQGEQYLHLHYEDVVAEPEVWLAKIETFTGAKNINREVMKVKVNTYGNDENLAKEDTGFLQPAELTKEEMKIVAAFTNKTQTI